MGKRTDMGAFAKLARDRRKDSREENKSQRQYKTPAKSPTVEEWNAEKAAGPNTSGKCWEYLIERHPTRPIPDHRDFQNLPKHYFSNDLVDGGRLAHDQWLNQLGADGWELVNLRRIDNVEGIFPELEYVFKREMK